MNDLAARLESRFNQTLAADAEVSDVANGVVSVWQDIAEAFSPIVGKRGVEALVRRALSISLIQFPWLSVAMVEPQPGDDFAGLRSALISRTGAEARHANAALLRTFFDVLANLIGAALTERLIRQALDNTSSDTAPQERST